MAETEPIETDKNTTNFACLSLILSMIFLPCYLLMVFISMIGYYSWNWHDLDNIIVDIITFTLPMLLCIASVVTGIKFFTSKGEYRKDFRMVIVAIVGLFFGIIELVVTGFVSVLYMSN